MPETLITSCHKPQLLESPRHNLSTRLSIELTTFKLHARELQKKDQQHKFVPNENAEAFLFAPNFFF